MLTSDDRKEIISKFQINEKDSGSAPVQVALITARIKDLTGHLRRHKKDHAARRGLRQMVGRRTSLLRYMKRRNVGLYQQTIQELGLRR